MRRKIELLLAFIALAGFSGVWLLGLWRLVEILMDLMERI